MFAVRCTRKLLNRGAPKALLTPEPPTTVLGDWYANIVFARPEHLAICISEHTLLSVVVTAKDVKRLPERVAAAVEQVLGAIGISHDEIRAELAEMQVGYLATTNSRRVLGSLNDIIYHFQYGAGSDTALGIQERTLRLARIPFAALEYAFPSEAAVAAFATNRALKAAKSAV